MLNEHERKKKEKNKAEADKKYEAERARIKQLKAGMTKPRMAKNASMAGGDARGAASATPHAHFM
jgi:hypothetical protein